ncbi:hypothetical protein [Cellvibrio mixtus]|uniref:hypothetical protein n=1 Tax=Cellvibrio mixtus TaxID=39650 RepID=UPI0005871138|nr:hypothetical protein [Cellvibrio mixtus]
MKQLRKFLVSLAVLFSVDASAISIDLIADHSSVVTGGTVVVQAKISGLDDNAAPSLGVYDLDFNFDSRLFSFKNLIWGDSDKGNQLDLNGFGSFQSAGSSTGSINLFELSFDDADSLNTWQAGGFTLFTLVFDAIATGTGNFFLGINSLGDADANALRASAGNTQVVVGSVPVSEPSTWLLLLGALSVLMLRARAAQSTK